MVTIQKATEDDLNAIWEIRLEMLKEINSSAEGSTFDGAFKQLSLEYFRNEEYSAFFAMANGTVIGYAAICYIRLLPTFDHPGGKRGHVMGVYVRNSYRRQGIALRMVKMLIEDAVRKGVTEITLDSTEDGAPLYEKCGFKRSDERMFLTLK